MSERFIGVEQARGQLGRLVDLGHVGQISILTPREFLAALQLGN
jgi:hypothetical protein